MNSGWNRHISGDSAVRSINYTGNNHREGWIWYLDKNTIHIGDGGISTTGQGGGLRLSDGDLTSLAGVINVRINGPNRLELEARIRDNGDIRVGLDITGAGEGETHIYGSRSNTFSGNITISGEHALVLYKIDAISISGDMHIGAGSKVISHKSGQIAKYVRVTIESRGSKLSKLVLINGVREEFHELVVKGKGVVEFQGSSTLILDELSVGVFDTLTVVGWEHNKDLFLVRKTSAHVKDSLSHIVFQGQRGRVHLEDYNKDYWVLTTAPEAASYGAILGALGLGLFAYRKQRVLGARHKRAH